MFKKQHFSRASVKWQSSNHRVSTTSVLPTNLGYQAGPTENHGKLTSHLGRAQVFPWVPFSLHLNKFTDYIISDPIHCIFFYMQWVEFVLYLCGNNSPFLWFVFHYLNQLPTFLPSPSLRKLKRIQRNLFSQKWCIHKECVQMFPGWSYAAAKTLLIIKCKMDCSVIETLWGSDTFEN